MTAFDYGPQTYRYMLQNDADMVDMLIGEADTGIAVDPNFPIKGAVDYLVDFGLATDRQDAFHKLGVTLMVGQDDTVYVPGDTPAGFSPRGMLPPSRRSPRTRSGERARPDGASWAQQNGVGCCRFGRLRDRPSYNTALVQPHAGRDLKRDHRIADGRNRQGGRGGSSSVALPFEPSSRSVTGGNLYNANNEWLGTFQVQGSTVTIAYVPAWS